MNRVVWLALASAGSLAFRAQAVGPEKSMMTVEAAFDSDCKTLVWRQLTAAQVFAKVVPPPHLARLHRKFVMIENPGIVRHFRAECDNISPKR